MNFPNYRYIYPPRPKNPIPPKDLDYWDNGNLIAQPKVDGSNSTIYLNGKDCFIMNRHNQTLSGVQIRSEIASLFKGTPGKWTVLNGEYLNKNKSDENGKSFNHKFIVFDILVHDSDYLIGKTFSERIGLLDSIYGQESSDKEYFHGISDNIYRVKTYETNFSELFHKLSKIELVEGLVLKRSKARLEFSSNENNNVNSQLKCRKPTKNFKF